MIALVPIPRVPNVWLMLDGEGWLHRVDVANGRTERGGRIDSAHLDLTQRVVLKVSPGGELAAVAEARGRRGLVVEPASGQVVRTLERGRYHVEHCTFPLGFFELDGKLLLIHGTDWNRLGVSDPRTGQLLTARGSTSNSDGDARPEHCLDYFHSNLTVSPNGTRVVDNGWAWHPVGYLRVFDLHRWVRENPWEPEDGPSVHVVSDVRAYYWDGPVCWLDEQTVAVWGEGEDEMEMLPAVTLYDAASGHAIRMFRGPGEGLASVPPWLVSWDAERPTSVWDWKTGERVSVDGSFRPIAVHPASHELLSREEDGRFRMHRLVASS